MKTIYLLKLSLVALIFIFSSCEDEVYEGPTDGGQDNGPDTFSEYFGSDINRDFIGNVIDENGDPVSGVNISIGSNTATTDNNGVFIIKNADVKERFAYVKAEKPGYIHGSRTLAPSEGVNKVEIMLLQENVISTINSGSAETVSLPSGASVGFDGNFIKSDGSAYSGSVDVIMHHLDPANEDMRLQMPGMLYAQNQNGAERMLQTFGMMAVELRGSSGEELNLAEGSTAQITMPLDNSLLSTAPQTIPLWYFDEDLGYWKEEGQATLQGNAYVGEVSHFSFWNCDIPASASLVCITVLSDAGLPLSNLTLQITSSSFGTTSGITNANGQTCGFMPNGEVLELNVFYNDGCQNTPVHTENIGPFSNDASVTISLSSLPGVITETITGTFNACDGNAVENGYVELTYNNLTTVDIIDNADFEINVLRCEDELSFLLEGYDYTNLQTTGAINYTFTTPSTDVGILTACNSITEFIMITVEDFYEAFYTININATFNEDVDFSNFNSPYLNISADNNDDCLYIFGLLDAQNLLGTYDSNLNFDDSDNTGFQIITQECNSGIAFGSEDLSFNVTALGNPGEYIDINISGTVQDTLNVTHNFTGIIHVLRDE